LFIKVIVALIIMLTITVDKIVNVSASTNLPNELTDETISLGVLVGDAYEHGPGWILPTAPDLDLLECPVCGRLNCPNFSRLLEPMMWRPVTTTTPATSPTLNNTEGGIEEDNEEDAAHDNEGHSADEIEDALEDDPFGPRALSTISDTSTAVQAVHNAFIRMSPEYLETGLLELFAEQAIGRAASGDVSGNLVVVSQASIAPLENIAIDTRDAIYGMLLQEGYEPWRDLRANISFVTNYREMEIRVEPSSYQAAVQHVKVRTPYYEVTFPSNFIVSEATDDPLTVNVMAGNIHTIQFSREVNSPLILSVPPLYSTTTAYQTLMSIEGATALTKYNPASSLLEARISFSGIFTTRVNRVDFEDIQGLSAEMQRAIRELASQNIISGTGRNRFGPNDSISRAEIATITVRMLGRLDPSAVSSFVDVRPNNWFYVAVSSAYMNGIMRGQGRYFLPSSVITRNQVTSVAARILRIEMNYRTPSNPNRYLSRYTDRNDFASWSLGDISLATRAGIVIPRTDGRFLPNAPVNRGDAALLLYRMYQRLQ